MPKRPSDGGSSGVTYNNPANPRYPKGEEPGGRAGNPAKPKKKPAIGIGNGPGHPHAVPKPHQPYDPYAESVQQNLQYLTSQQRAETQKRQQQLDTLKQQAQDAQKRLIAVRDLRAKGEQGVRAQQALLRQAGYNITVDGRYGKATDQALNDYLKKQSETWNKKLTDKAQQAHPLSLRGEANKAIPLAKTKNSRAFIIAYANKQQADLRAALADAEKKARNGDPKGADTVKNIKDAIKGLDTLRATAMDPIKGMDATDLDRTMRKIVLKQQNDLQQGNIDAASQVVGLGQMLRDTVLETLNTATLNLFNRGSSAFAAGFETGLHTGDYSKALEAFAGAFTSFVRVPFTDLSLVGLIAPGGSDARKYIEATNTQAEMDDLVKQGDLLSIGQTLTGRVTEEFAKKHPLGLGNAGSLLVGIGTMAPGDFTNEKVTRLQQEQTVVTHGFDLLSAAADFGAQPLKDPTLLGAAAAAEGGFSEFGNVQRQIAKAAGSRELDRFGEEGLGKLIRLTRIEHTPTGRALLSHITEAVDRSYTALDLEKHIPGLGHDAAMAAMAAKEADVGGVEAAAAVVKDAFVEGKWNPHISVVRQLTNDIGAKLGIVSSEGKLGFLGADIGSKAIKMQDKLQALRVVAEPKGPVAAAFERDAVSFVDESLHAATTAERSTLRAMWERVVGQSVKGVDLEARFYNALSDVYATENPQLQAAFEGVMRKFFNNPELLNKVPLGTYLEAAFNQAGFEEAIQKMELIAAIATGKAGDAAFGQLSADLARGFLLPKNATKAAFTNAVSNVGLKLGAAKTKVTKKGIMDSIRELPAEDRSYFTDRLSAIQGKKGLGRLAADVELAKGSPELRAELQRLLTQNEGRAAQTAAGGLAKPGLVQRARRPLAKLVLANRDTVAPTEIRFKYDTPNELFHSRMRAVAGDRYLKAFYVPRTVRQTLIRALEKVETEEEMFSVVERMTRAALDAKGVTNADGVIALLTARGSFKKVATKPVRTIVDGVLTEDLQTLAQRIEAARLFSPAEVAGNIHKAILDGIEDASVARRFAANLRVNVVGKFGDIELRFTHINGQVMTIRSSAKSFHRIWKFLIVTNAAMPIIGATAGFVGTQGDIGDRLHNAGIGFAIGSVGGLRYVFRIAGIEERSRILLDQGLNAEIHIPGWAKIQARRYGEDPFRRTMSDNLTRIGNQGTSHLDNELLTHVDPDWIALDRSHPRAVDAWYRIINHQIHPESDPVIAILLREQAGHLAGEEEVTRIVKVRTKDLEPKDIHVSTVGAAEDTRSEFQKQMDGLTQEVLDSGVGPVKVSNENLLEEFGTADTKTFFRGEDNALGREYPNRGSEWIPEDYNAGKGEQYARGFAGEEGRVYKVELPVDATGKPLVGTAAEGGDLGWTLAGEDSRWADSADEMLPNGMAGREADRATYKKVTKTRVVTDREAADRQIQEFLNTEEGQLWKERWRGASGGAGPKKAVARMRDFLDRYSTPELANLRVAGGVNGVAGQIDHDTLARMLKTGIGPDQFHAQQAWKVPRNSKQLFHAASNLESKFVLSGPSNLLNRGPYFRSLFGKEYDRLVMNGVAKEEAQRLADYTAANHLNEVLDRMDDPSRFASKVDMFLPFQQAREDTVVAYGRLLRERPINSARLVVDVARLFNNGASIGMFTKNEFTGQWQLTVPFSGRLSHSLFKLPFDVGFSSNLKDLLFVGQGYGVGILPQPGGLYWSSAARLVAEAHPEVFTGKYPLHDWLWGYGPQGNLLRKDTSRLWMAFTGEAPPWERLTQDEWKNQHDRWQVEIAQQLIYEHRKKNPADRAWVPTNDDLDEATKKFYQAWAFIGTTFPASSYPTLTGQDKYWAARNAFTVGGILDWDPQAFLKKYPEFEAFTVGANAEYTGPDDLTTLNNLNVGDYNPLQTFDPATGTWKSTGNKKTENYSVENALGYRTYRSFAKFKEDFKFYQRQGDYFRGLDNARALQDFNPILAEHDLSDLNKKYADVVQHTRRTYDIKKDLYNINWKYPKNLRAGAIARVKAQYGLSNKDLNYFMQAAADPDFMPNAWREARLGSEIDAEVRLKFGNTISSGTDVGSQAYGTAPVNGDLEKYVATLNPAEQANYWRHQKQALGYDPNLDNASSVMAKYKYFQSQLSAVYNNYPWLLKADDHFSQGTRTYKDPKTGKRVDVLTNKEYVNPFDASVAKEQTRLNTQASATYNTIAHLSSEMDAAAKAKNWKAFYAMKAQRDSLYDLADSIHNHLRGKLPNLHNYYDDLHAAALAGAAGNTSLRDQYLHKAAIDKADAPYFLIPEEQRFAHEPPAVQRAYMETLVQGLDMPEAKGQNYDDFKKLMDYVKNETGLKKLFWDYLSPFQQDILERNFPTQVEQWKYNSQVAVSGKKGKLPKELAWAYAQLSHYNKRGDQARPASYDEYLRLPSNLAAREQFLNAHPDVRSYINNGPFKHMPKALRDQVSSILNKYGKYNGNSSRGYGGGGTHIKNRGLGYEGNLNVAWAHEQLYIWSRRKDATKPANYDLWVNMPTGIEKANYLKAHPELQQWIRLGPMANMPEEYKQMVSDIMQRYGEWTQKDDPLGKTITEFFKTPGYAREEFLQKHPELEAYWSASRSPEENALFDLRNEYFKIQDVAARQAFLQSHPELQQDFIDARTKRYERFLNQVAVYMGANPEMFTQYLTRQTDIMAELLRKFAEPTLIREVGPSYVSGNTQGAESGRQRAQQRPPRVRATA